MCQFTPATAKEYINHNIWKKRSKFRWTHGLTVILPIQFIIKNCFPLYIFRTVVHIITAIHGNVPANLLKYIDSSSGGTVRSIETAPQESSVRDTGTTWICVYRFMLLLGHY